MPAFVSFNNLGRSKREFYVINAKIYFNNYCVLSQGKADAGERPPKSIPIFA